MFLRTRSYAVYSTSCEHHIIRTVYTKGGRARIRLMTVRDLKIIVNTAMVSDEFRKGMLAGKRAELLKEYDLAEDERSAVMAIKAAIDADFYKEMETIIDRFTLLEKGAKR